MIIGDLLSLHRDSNTSCKDYIEQYIPLILLIVIRAAFFFFSSWNTCKSSMLLKAQGRYAK